MFLFIVFFIFLWMIVDIVTPIRKQYKWRMRKIRAPCTIALLLFCYSLGLGQVTNDGVFITTLATTGGDVGTLYEDGGDIEDILDDNNQSTFIYITGSATGTATLNAFYNLGNVEEFGTVYGFALRVKAGRSSRW